MIANHAKSAFVELGKFLAQFKFNQVEKHENVLHNDLFFQEFIQLIENQKHYNGWFLESEVFHAIQSWANALTSENLNQWLGAYPITESEPKTVGLILAGNIPLVGFHDFLCVLITGHKALIKTSSNDKHLLPFIAKYLIAACPELQDSITFTQERLSGYDAVIATGSNNTARYFEYYFKDKPSIIRKNRNSVAILTGEETLEQLIALGKDIFTYFGLGCRSISKIYVPQGYNFENFFKAMYTYHEIINNQKYINNYDYNKAVFLMSNYLVLDNGFLVLKEDTSYASPIACLFYEQYDNLDQVFKQLNEDFDKIQCIVSNNLQKEHISFGQTQNPQLWNYADNVDTIEFLIKL